MTKAPSMHDFMQSSMSVELHVSELQLGMYVSRLDCDWLETPFLVQGFVIETLDDIDLLAQHCEHVWVDQKVDHLTADYKVSRQAMLGQVKPTIHKIPDRARLEKSAQSHRGATETARKMLSALRTGDALQEKQAKSTVAACVRNVMADPGVALLVMKVRECDDVLADHAINVCVLTVAFGRFLGMNTAELFNVGICGLLHDVGKVKLPKHLLNGGAKTETEREEYQAHTIAGRNILSSAKNIYMGAVDVAYSHHEHVDGTGYPRKLKSAGINHFTKMVAICDAYETMTSMHGNKQALSSTEALKKLLAERNRRFDAELVDHFMKMVGLYPPGTIVELMNGYIGIVIAKNYRYQHLPKLIVVLDENKQEIKQKVIDLSKTVHNKLDSAYLIHMAHLDGAFGVYLQDYRDKGLVLQ